MTQKFLLGFLLLFSSYSFAQKKTEAITDTSINKFDVRGNKVGFWKEKKKLLNLKDTTNKV